MAIKINCENRNVRRKVDLSRIKKVATVVLKSHRKNNVELNIILVDNRKIRALNRRYLNIDSATDVIAFPFGEEAGSSSKGQGARVKVKDKGRKFLGDIAVSSDKAAQNAKVYGVSFIEEVALCVIHGTLHLIGYKDTAEKERAVMRRKEHGV